MPRAINCAVVTLIPKNDNPTTVKEYRPIACCTILYKIIAKVIASRLQKVISSIISKAQVGFIPGRKISDNIFLAQELVKSYTRKNTSPRCMLKIDLQKAYDSVEWVFLEQMMDELGFPRKFIGWVRECATTVNYTILINGEPTEPFNAAKGLRQGDPMSPFMFAISMEYLSRRLNALKEEKVFKYHPRCSGLGVTHLSFADDLLLFSRGDLILSISLLLALKNSQQLQDSWRTIEKVLYILGVSIRLFRIKFCNTSAFQKGNSPLIPRNPTFNQETVPHSMATIDRKNGCKDLVLDCKKAFIWGYYIKNQQFNQAKNPQQVSWMVRQLFEARELLFQGQPSSGTDNRIKTFYLQLVGEHTRIQWKCLMYANDARRKAVFTMWLAMHGRLLTLDRLDSWGMIVDTKCVLCQGHDETRNHLLLECSFSKSVWQSILKWMKEEDQRAISWDRLTELIIRKSKGKSKRAQIFKLVVTEFIYAIWIERNARLYEVIFRKNFQQS
ncbi:uncharacterized protein LOC132048717 [Lycium ferocissimum]|uniref:uncharacterized protein LOC132048717 n=1 Tax=Lycium ferocissimum TaxID=112874 RepID=UPI0028150131|nr:uncharacterized protein LOC132048717 [Lycium ferocissimum]